ncbi:MAG: hypothetical protein IKN91_00925 [Paludibacteraceae bacterium]|nr:hypothetical protein [Paludibacteraceae bacterium]
MDTLLKYLGAIIVLIGVIVLVVYHFGTPSNALLVVSIVLMLVGIGTHIVVNRLKQ